MKKITKHFHHIKSRAHALLKRKNNHSTSHSSKKSQRALIRKILIGLLLLYILGGIVLGFLVYGKKNHSSNTLKALRLYPLPAVLVDGQPVSVRTIYQQINFVERFSGQTGQKIDSFDTLKGRAIDQQIEAVLVKKETEKLKLKVTDKDVDNAYKKITTDNGGEEEVKKVLNTLYGMSLPEFKALLKVQLTKDRLQQDGVERAEVRHILVSDEGKAKQIIDDINNNRKSFEDAAKEFSKDATSKDNGGLLGKIPRGIMPEAFDKVAFEWGEIGKTYYQPVKTDFGYHIIRVDGRSGKIKQSFQAWLDEAKKKVKVIKFLK